MGVGVCEVAASSRRPWCVGDLDGVGVAFGDLVSVGGREGDGVGLRVGSPDLVGLPVACGDLVGVMRMQAPQVEAV